MRILQYLRYYVGHSIERQGKKYVCTVCQRRWSHKSMIHYDCPRQSDMPVYIGWENTPAHLQTKSRLHLNGYKPGGPHRAAFRYNNHAQICWLYDIREAIPRPKPTIKQLINLGHPSVAGMWICHDCRQVYHAADKQYPGLYCKDCARKWARLRQIPEPY
jgi:hypothetical protein